jgi:nitroreductase
MFRIKIDKNKEKDKKATLKELEKLLEATAYKTTSGLMAYQETDSYEKIKKFIKER